MPTWTLCCIFDTVSRPLDPLKWLLTLCYEAYRNINKSTSMTLRFSKRTVLSFDKRILLVVPRRGPKPGPKITVRSVNPTVSKWPGITAKSVMNQSKVFQKHMTKLRSLLR